MTHLLTRALKVLTLYATVQIKLYAYEILNRVRRFSLGAFLALTSLVFWLIGFVLIFLALFFYFAGNVDLVVPGIKTALISMGTGMAITASGIWIMKKQSHRYAYSSGDAKEKHPGKEFSETFLQEARKLIDDLLAEFTKQEKSGDREAQKAGTKGEHKGISWFHVVVLFALGFIAGIVVSSIKRKTDPSEGTPENPR